MARKSFDVETFKNTTNKVLTDSVVDAEMRKGWIAALEFVLHSTDNYRGFRYLTTKEVPYGALPGIRLDSEGNPLPGDRRFENCDETRRAYS
jgi:hypothetical protein